MLLETTDNSTSLEKQLQAEIYDLNSCSAALSMHKAFEKNAKHIIPLLSEVLNIRIAQEFRQRFKELLKEYNKIGKPDRVLNIHAQRHLQNIQNFSRDLEVLMVEKFPIKVKLNARVK